MLNCPLFGSMWWPLNCPCLPGPLGLSDSRICPVCLANWVQFLDTFPWNSWPLLGQYLWYGGFHSHGGSPKWWFIRGKSLFKLMIWGYPYFWKRSAWWQMSCGSHLIFPVRKCHQSCINVRGRNLSSTFVHAIHLVDWSDNNGMVHRN